MTCLSKKNGKRYFCEAKCWPATNDGIIHSLTQLEQIIKRKDNHKLKQFLVDASPSQGKIKVQSQSYNWHGKILLWWDMANNGQEIEKIKSHFQLNNVFSVKALLSELIDEDQNGKWRHWLNKMERAFENFQEIFRVA